ncbi:hypothetical protein V8F33_005366 [Rhypophila sp. PSN 637]
MSPFNPRSFRTATPTTRLLLIGVSALSVTGGASYLWYQQQKRFQDRNLSSKPQRSSDKGHISAVSKMTVTTPFQVDASSEFADPSQDMADHTINLSDPYCYHSKDLWLTDPDPLRGSYAL